MYFVWLGLVDSFRRAGLPVPVELSQFAGFTVSGAEFGEMIKADLADAAEPEEGILFGPLPVPLFDEFSEIAHDALAEVHAMKHRRDRRDEPQLPDDADAG